MNETLQIISRRKSCRNFQDVKLSHTQINLILQAGLQAPSAMNRQQVVITALTNKKTIASLAYEIAKALDKEAEYSCFYHAPCIIIVSAPKDYPALLKDGSCTMQNMFLAATSLQIGSCWIDQLGGLEDVPAIRSLLSACNIPSTHSVCGCVSLGYEAEESLPKEKNSRRIQIID